MYPLVESVKVIYNRFVNIEYHNLRLNKTRKELFGKTDAWNIPDYIKMPQTEMDKIYKCRFLYGVEPGPAEFTVYTMRIIKHLKLIRNDEMEYAYKYTNRKNFEGLLAGCTPQMDILLVKNGLVTDTSFSNIVFDDGTGWITPATPMLSGTKRQYYLNRNMIRPVDIRPVDLNKFSRARLINAMLDLETSPDLPIENISW